MTRGPRRNSPVRTGTEVLFRERHCPIGWARALWGGAILASAAVSFFVLFHRFQHNDDAFITFRVARNLARGLGPYYNPPEAVQATSTPLYMLLLAGGHRVTHIPIERLESAFEVVGVVAVGVLLFALGRAMPLFRPVAPLLPLIFFLQPYPIVVVKGMEAFFYAAFILLAAWCAVKRRSAWLGVAFGLAAALRPEGGMLGVSYFAFWTIGRAIYGKREFSWRDLGWTVVLAGLTGLPFLVFVWTQYGALVPASVLGKIAQAQLGWTTFGQELRLYLFGSLPLPRIWGPLLVLCGFLLVAGGRSVDRDATSYRGFGLLGIHGLFYGGVFILARAPNYLWYLFPLTVMMIPFFALPFVVLWRMTRGDSHLSLRPNHVSEGNDRAISPNLATRRMARSGLLALIGYGIFIRAAALIFVVSLTVRQVPGFMDDLGYNEAGRWLGREAGHTNWTFASPEIGILGYYSDMRCLDLLGLASPECRRYAGVEPLTRTVLRFRPELYVTTYYPELIPTKEQYDRELRETFTAQYRLVRTFPSLKNPIRVYCRNDLPWPPKGAGRFPDSEKARSNIEETRE